MPDIGDFIRRSRRSAKIAIAAPGTPGDFRRSPRSAYKIARCVAGFRNMKNLLSESHSREYTECRDFTLLFCREQMYKVLKCTCRAIILIIQLILCLTSSRCRCHCGLLKVPYMMRTCIRHAVSKLRQFICR